MFSGIPVAVIPGAASEPVFGAEREPSFNESSTGARSCSPPAFDWPMAGETEAMLTAEQR
jgi:hypothetical protein